MPIVKGVLSKCVEKLYDSTVQNGTVLFHVGANGNLGIGTATPSQKLDVNGNLKSSGDIANPSFNLQSYYGDLMMRRYAAGDTKWKRALVPANELIINYSGDFSNGVRIMVKD